METTEQTTNKLPYGGKLDSDVYAAVDQLRVDEDRNFSNMIERLLKTHPRVQEILGTAEASAVGGN